MALCVRYAVWTYFITMRFGFVNSALLYLAYNWFASTYIFVNFAVSHTHLPVVRSAIYDFDYYSFVYAHIRCIILVLSILYTRVCICE